MNITNKGLYWGLIGTFGVLYVLVAFVSTLHAIDFFKLANVGALAILLGIAYEVGQAAVLFSILMTKNKERFLPWLLMFLLTALQVTANVYASFKHMSLSGNDDWNYWYISILKIFGVMNGTPETYQVIISWISGALLPIVALGMTALVANNIKMISEEQESPVTPEPIPASDIIAEVSRIRPTEEELAKAESILLKMKSEEEKKKELEEENDPIKVIAQVRDEDDKHEVFPALSDEEVTKMFHDELEGKLLDDVDDEEEYLSQLNSPIIEEKETLEPQPSDDIKDEVLKKIHDIFTVPEIVPPKPSETPRPSEPLRESEEERLERLRNIARENLKKK